MPPRKKTTKRKRNNRGGARPGAGRPSTGEAADAWLTVRVQQELLDRARRAERKTGRNLPDFIREKLNDFCDL